MSNEEPLSRPRYYTGQLLTSKDFMDEQEYFLAKHRRHNRRLHGYGVVWGLEVRVSPSQQDGVQVIRISPGFAMDRNGDEILVPRPQQAELPPGDPGNTIWVKLCYAETPSDGVPLPYDPGTEQIQEATRTVEDFKLCLSTSPECDCDNDAPLCLARLACSARGWIKDPTYQPPRLYRITMRTLWAASVLGAMLGLLVGMLLPKKSAGS
jgi:hypothetical protein